MCMQNSPEFFHFGSTGALLLLTSFPLVTINHCDKMPETRQFTRGRLPSTLVSGQLTAVLGLEVEETG